LPGAVVGLPPLGPGHHPVDVAAAAPGTDQPIAPLRNGGPGTISLCHFDRVGLGPVATRLAPHDQPHFRVRRVAHQSRTGGRTVSK